MLCIGTETNVVGSFEASRHNHDIYIHIYIHIYRYIYLCIYIYIYIYCVTHTVLYCTVLCDRRNVCCVHRRPLCILTATAQRIFETFSDIKEMAGFTHRVHEVILIVKTSSLIQSKNTSGLFLCCSKHVKISMSLNLSRDGR